MRKLGNFKFFNVFSSISFPAQIGDGKYVVIQNSKGVQIPLKVVTQPKTVTTSQTTTTTNNIQIVKAPSTVLVKPSTSVATKDGTQTFQISSSNNQGITGTTKTKFIVKGRLLYKIAFLKFKKKLFFSRH